MSREIKFRCWDGFKIHEDLRIETSDDFSSLNAILKKIQNTEFYHLMQFTGLHDKNGNEIFERDIVKSFLMGKPEDAEIWEVKIYPCCAISSPYGKAFDNSWIEHEVIGNIYENPELLEKQVDS